MVKPTTYEFEQGPSDNDPNKVMVTSDGSVFVGPTHKEIARHITRLESVNADLLAALEAAKLGFESIVPYAPQDIKIVAEACIEEIDKAGAKARE